MSQYVDTDKYLEFVDGVTSDPSKDLAHLLFHFSDSFLFIGLKFIRLFWISLSIFKCYKLFFT